MKKVINFLVFALFMSHNAIAVAFAQITMTQAFGVVETGSSSASANNFYNLISDYLPSSMTQSIFNGYYQANFVVFDQSEIQSLFNKYSSDVEGKNYSSAQKDLIKLAAASFKSIDTRYLLTTLHSFDDPFNNGSPFFTYTHTDGPPDLDLVQVFVDHFVNLYNATNSTSSLPVGGSTSSTGTTSHSSGGTSSTGIISLGGSTGTTTHTTSGGQTSTAGLMSEKNSAIKIIVGYQKNAATDLNSEAQKVVGELEGIQKAALADSNIGESSVQESYLSDLEVKEAVGLDSLNTIADNSILDVQAAQDNAVDKLTLLGMSDNNAALAAAYISNVDTQVTTSEKAIEDISKYTTLISSAKSAAKKAIQGAAGSGSGSGEKTGGSTGTGDKSPGDTGSSGGGIGEDIENWAKNFFGKIWDDIGSVGALGFVTFVGAYIKYKFFGGERPTSKGLGFSDTLSSLVDGAVDRLDTITGADDPKAAMLKMLKNAPADVVTKVAGTVRESLGVSEEDFNSIMGDIQSTLGDKGKLGDIADTISEVADKIPGVSKATVSQKLGEVLSEGGKIDQIASLVEKINAKLGVPQKASTDPKDDSKDSGSGGGSGEKINTGSEGGDTTSSISNAFKELHAEAITAQTTEMKNYILTEKTSETSFKQYLEDLKTKVANLEENIEKGNTADEDMLNDLKIKQAAAENVLKDDDSNFGDDDAPVNIPEAV